MTESSESRIPPQQPSLSTISLSIPVAMGYVPLGAVFGFLLVQAGTAWWIPPVASLLVFAGAAQFMVVPMLTAGASISTIIMATAVINLRHIFYGISLLDKLPSSKLARAYLIWVLTDENYSVITTLPSTASTKQIVGVAMLNHLWWVLGALLGAILGAQAPITIIGLDFSLAALFAVLTVEQWRATKQTMPILVAILAYVIALKIAPLNALMVSIGCSLSVGAILSRHASTRRVK